MEYKQHLISASKKLIRIYQDKIKERIGEGEGGRYNHFDPSMSEKKCEGVCICSYQRGRKLS